jgi:hypothetical protein
MLSVSLDCPFLIAPSVFSHVYLQKNQELIKLKLLHVYITLDTHLIKCCFGFVWNSRIICAIGDEEV